MRIFLALLYCALTAFWGADAFAQATPTLWDHNGSQVSLSANGAVRQFHYKVPAAELLDFNVRPGTLLFDGRKDGKQYSGKAYVFSKLCGPLAYAVSGPVSQDDRTVTLYGYSPVADTSCRVIGHRDEVDVLVFTFLPGVQTGSNQGVPVQPHDAAYDTFVNQWSECFEVVDSTSSLNFAVIMCDLALSYPRLIDNDRALLLKRLTDLKQQKFGFVQQETVVPKDHRPVTDQRTVPPVSDNSPGPAAKTVDKPSIDPTTLLQVGGVGIVLLFLVIAAQVQSNSRSRPAMETAGEKAPPNSGNLPAGLPTPTGAVHEPPSQSMSLKLRHSQKSGFRGKIIFALDARIGLNAEEYSLVRKYGLGDRLVYDSSARKRHTERTREHLDMTRDHPPISAGFTTQLFGLGKTLYRVGRAAVSVSMAGLSTRITIDRLIRGSHIKSESMDELLEAKTAIVEAFRNLKAHLETAETFDGREEVIE